MQDSESASAAAVTKFRDGDSSTVLDSENRASGTRRKAEKGIERFIEDSSCGLPVLRGS